MTKPANPFRYFDSSPEVIRLVVMMYVRYPLSLRNVEDLLFERGIDICHEGIVKAKSILPFGAPGRKGLSLFLLINFWRDRNHFRPKKAYTHLL